MRAVAAVCGVALGTLVGCASAPTLPTLVEQRQVYEQRAQDRYQSGELADAVANFRQAVHLAELADDSDALLTDLLNLGSATSEFGRYEAAAAAAAFERARKLATVDGRDELALRAMVGVAQVDYRRGDHAGAQALYQQVMERSPSGDRQVRNMALNGLALCALAGGDMDAADRYLTQAQALDDSASTALNRATLALRRGRVEDAERAANRALTLDRSAGYVPGIANDLEVLGEAQRRLGKDQEARLNFTQALSLYEQLQASAAVDRIRRRLK